MAINKPERINMLQEALEAQGVKLTKTATGAAYDAVNALHEQILLQEGQLTVQGFGSFRTDELEARERRNPRTGETFTAAPTRKVRFKASVNLNKKAVEASQEG